MGLKLKVDAITLGSFPFGESHKVITLMTKKHGIVKGVAHGVRKPTSKFGSSMELFNTVELVLQNSKNNELYSIREYSVIQSRHELRSNPLFTGFLFYLAELINELYKIAPHHKEIFRTVNVFLDNFKKNNFYTIFRALTIKLLFETGFIGEAGRCSECEKNAQEFYITQTPGFFYCHDCMKSNTTDKISAGSMKIISKLESAGIDEINRIKINAEQRKELDIVVNTLVRGIFGKTLKSEQFLYLNNPAK